MLYFVWCLIQQNRKTTTNYVEYECSDKSILWMALSMSWIWHSSGQFSSFSKFFHQISSPVFSLVQSSDFKLFAIGLQRQLFASAIHVNYFYCCLTLYTPAIIWCNSYMWHHWLSYLYHATQNIFLFPISMLTVPRETIKYWFTVCK